MRGVELKLVPAGDKLEARFKGPNITPGYWRRPDLTAAAFDDEGYYKIGDAFRFADPSDPPGACCSMAGWPRISSSPPAPGSAPAHCARSSSIIARRWGAMR